MLELKTTVWEEKTTQEQKLLLERPIGEMSDKISRGVNNIINVVRRDGDRAVLEFTEKFDGVKLDSIKVSKEEFDEAVIPKKTQIAIEQAALRIKEFHSMGLSENVDVELSKGSILKKIVKPIERVGLYIPGGSAPLISTVLMLAIPAQIAGAKLKVLVTPPGKDGKVDPAILFAAKFCGIGQVFKAGGAQAVAAMAFGTETIPKVDKIFGPGNAWVTEAKTQVALDPNGATCDMPAGPSEVLVIADETANPLFIALDLMSQAEHGEDSQVVLLSDSNKVIEEVKAKINEILIDFPRRDIAVKSLKYARFIKCRDLKEAISISNIYAPEHLIIQTKNFNDLEDKIENAGSVFLGRYTPESVGDYASGTNHVLPTYGYARSISGLSVDAFQKKITFQEFSREALLEVGPIVEELADVEGLFGHKSAVTARLNEIRKL